VRTYSAGKEGQSESVGDCVAPHPRIYALDAFTSLQEEEYGGKSAWLDAEVFGCMGRGVNYTPKHLDTFKGAPLRLPMPLSDSFPLRVLVSPFVYAPSVRT